MIKDFYNKIDSIPRWRFLFFGITAFFVLLTFSPWTCISTPYFLADSSVYALIGKGMCCSDLMPYRDFFDHKGPFVYFFYALAACFGNIKLGLTILQTLWLTYSLLLVYKISRFYISPAHACQIAGVYILVFVLFMGEGANTEELSLPFSLLSLYFSIKYLKSDFSFSDGKYKFYLHFVTIGACIGILCMVRPNNAIISCTCCLVMALNLILHQRWKQFVLITALCCVGFIVFILFFIAYLYTHSLLSDYWYCYITFNSKYAIPQAPVIYVLVQFFRFPFLLLLPLYLWHYYQFRAVYSGWDCILLTFLCLFSFLCACMGQAIPHYLLLCLPAYIYIGILAMKCIEEGYLPSYHKRLIYLFPLYLLWTNNTSCYKATLSAASILRSCHLGTHSTEKAPLEVYKEAMQLARYIPNEEKKDFLCVNMFGREYMYMDTFPCCRLFILQDFLSKQDPSLKSMFSKELASHAPKWLLTKPDEDSDMIPWDSYELFMQTASYKLYRLK